MKKLPAAKKNQLIMVLATTAALIAAVYFLLIGPQNAANNKLAKDTGNLLSDLEKHKQIINQAQATSNQLVQVSAQLDEAEADTATGDVYAWIYDTIRRFKTNYHVDIPTIGQPTIGDADILPNFPYKQLRVSLTGTAYYQDLGKFLADMENTFPHVRLVNLTVEPNGLTEKLSFRVDMIALIKPNS